MIYIFGGISLDFIFTKETFIKGTSNPSCFTYRIGGVAYNIFNSLEAKEKIFITTIGNDAFGKIILDSINSRDINKIIFDDYTDNDNDLVKFKSNLKNNDDNQKKLESLDLNNLPAIIFMIVKDYPTSIYNVLMQQGSCYIATADFRIIEKNLTFSKLSNILSKIKEDDIVVLDSNIHNDELEKIFNNLSERKIKIFFETISFEKTKRAKNTLKNIYFTSPDNLEFDALIEGYESVFDCMENQNIEYILRTDGADGSTLFKKKDRSFVKYKPKRVLNVKDTTGAGDFLFSKIIQLSFEGFSIEKSIEIASEKVIEYLIKLNDRIS
ncbi:MAG: hypothetical protein GYA61_05175 [Spirochaetales bacterium]|jgi:sugar/nucleoside kinase (ribokinase family)|nr:hypothetical protein [Exilispira sp.]NMC67601.1 hypothetical protein [Spirochaetales bacterium]